MKDLMVYEDWRVCYDLKTHKYKVHCFFKAPFLQREKAAYIKLRRVGLSINQIAAAFGRSTSCVFRTLRVAYALKTLRRIDIRKLPYRARVLAASFRWARMLKLLKAWEAWICGEGEEPP